MNEHHSELPFSADLLPEVQQWKEFVDANPGKPEFTSSIQVMFILGGLEGGRGRVAPDVYDAYKVVREKIEPLLQQFRSQAS